MYRHYINIAILAEQASDQVTSEEVEECMRDKFGTLDHLLRGEFLREARNAVHAAIEMHMELGL